MPLVPATSEQKTAKLEEHYKAWARVFGTRTRVLRGVIQAGAAHPWTLLIQWMLSENLAWRRIVKIAYPASGWRVKPPPYCVKPCSHALTQSPEGLREWVSYFHVNEVEIQFRVRGLLNAREHVECVRQSLRAIRVGTSAQCGVGAPDILPGTIV